jgi:hypothetical protein
MIGSTSLWLWIEENIRGRNKIAKTKNQTGQQIGLHE